MTDQVNTFVIETRCDLRTVAAIARYYSEHTREPTKSRSNILRMTLEDFHSALEKNKLLKPILTQEEAKSILTELGIGIGKSIDRVRKGLANQLAVEARVGAIVGENPVAAALAALEDRSGEVGEL